MAERPRLQCRHCGSTYKNQAGLSAHHRFRHPGKRYYVEKEIVPNERNYDEGVVQPPASTRSLYMNLEVEVEQSTIAAPEEDDSVLDLDPPATDEQLLSDYEEPLQELLPRPLKDYSEPELPRSDFYPFANRTEYEVARAFKEAHLNESQRRVILDAINTIAPLHEPLPNSLDQMEARVASLKDLEAFTSTVILVHGLEFQLLSRNIFRLALDLFSDPLFKGHFCTHFKPRYQDQHRVYYEFWEGTWMEESMKTIPAGAALIGVILYADEKNIARKNNLNVYPVYMTLGNISVEARRKTSSKRLVGYLPLHKGRKRTALSVAITKKLRQECFRIILEPLVDAQKAYQEAKEPTGTLLQVVVRLALINSDWVEGSKFSMVLQMPSPRPCHNCLCLLRLFCDCEAGRSAPMRKQQVNRHLVAAALQEGGRNREAARAKEILKKISVYPLKNAFWALKDFDIHLSTPPDTLHTLDQGLFEWILKFIFKWVEDTYDETNSARIREEVRDRLINMPAFPGLTHFPQGFEKVIDDKDGRFQGTEFRNLMKQIVVVFVDLVEETEPLLLLLRYIEFYAALKRTPREDRLAHLEDAIAKLFDALSFFSKYSPSELRFPKLHVIVHYPLFLRRFGCYENFDTEHFEKLHHEMATIPYSQTNKNHETYLDQMADRVARDDVERRLWKKKEKTTHSKTLRLKGHGKTIFVEALPEKIREQVRQITGQKSIIKHHSATLQGARLYQGTGVDIVNPHNYFAVVQLLFGLKRNCPGHAENAYMVVQVMEPHQGVSGQARLAGLRTVKKVKRFRVVALSKVVEAIHFVPVPGHPKLFYSNHFVNKVGVL